jgi:putative Ca2+/H+ antiporter (TMEM165/GDT1 family)
MRKGDIKMKKEHVAMIIFGALAGHIVLSNISPKYRKIAKEVSNIIYGISIASRF